MIYKTQKLVVKYILHNLVLVIWKKKQLKNHFIY